MKLTLILADWAQVINGKLYVMGGGWTETGPAPTPSALAALIEVSWDETNRKHPVKFELVDSDGQPVMVVAPTGAQPVVVATEFEVGRPPGVNPGTSFNLPMALNFGPLLLPPGKEFVWRGFIDDRSVEAWVVTFRTRSVQPQQLAL